MLVREPEQCHSLEHQDTWFDDSMSGSLLMVCGGPAINRGIEFKICHSCMINMSQLIQAVEITYNM